MDWTFVVGNEPRVPTRPSLLELGSWGELGGAGGPWRSVSRGVGSGVGRIAGTSEGVERVQAATWVLLG